MAVNPDASFPRGDVMRRLAALERQVAALSTARRLEAAAVGRGGIRVHSGGEATFEGGGGVFVGDGGNITARGGTLLAEDLTGDDIFRVTTDPASIFMRQELIRDLSLAILADRLHSESIPLSGGSVSNPGATYIASGGPTLTGVDVSETGALILLITSRINVQINQPLGVSASGWMSFRITGATTVEPDDENSVHNDLFGPAADVIATTIGASRLVLVEGLNPGLHTIAARYRSVGVDPAPQHSVNFTSRNLTALAL